MRIPFLFGMANNPNAPGLESFWMLFDPDPCLRLCCFCLRRLLAKSLNSLSLAARNSSISLSISSRFWASRSAVLSSVLTGVGPPGAMLPLVNDSVFLYIVAPESVDCGRRYRSWCASWARCCILLEGEWYCLYPILRLIYDLGAVYVVGRITPGLSEGGYIDWWP